VKRLDRGGESSAAGLETEDPPDLHHGLLDEPVVTRNVEPADLQQGACSEDGERRAEQHQVAFVLAALDQPCQEHRADHVAARVLEGDGETQQPPGAGEPPPGRGVKSTLV
jgi:hypothetical protein